MSIDLDRCNLELRRILNQSLEYVGHLSELLHDERSALEEQDAGKLSTIVACKELAVRSMEKLEAERRSLCATAGVTADESGMEELLKSCDSSSALTSMWQTLLQTAKQCAALNHGNGAISRLRYEQVKSLVDMLYGNQDDNPLYNADGRGVARSEQHALARI